MAKLKTIIIRRRNAIKLQPEDYEDVIVESSREFIVELEDDDDLEEVTKFYRDLAAKEIRQDISDDAAHQFEEFWGKKVPNMKTGKAGKSGKSK